MERSYGIPSNYFQNKHILAKYDTILRILGSNQKWGKNARNLMQNMRLYLEFLAQIKSEAKTPEI